jgi:flagellar protein FliO/FliZ
MFDDYLLYGVFAVGALAALFVLTLAFRTVAGTVKGRRGSRLGISEFHEIDKQRRLVLVRRDDVEHLVLIGGGQDLVIETNIPAEGLRPEVAPAAPRLRPVDRLDAEEQDAQEAQRVRQEPELVRQEPPLVRQEPALVRQEPELVRQEPELVRQEPELPREPAVVRPMPLRAAPRPAVFGDRAPAEDRPPRSEPRLQAVPAQPSQTEAS